jgi:uncharacterized membrane protein
MFFRKILKIKEGGMRPNVQAILFYILAAILGAVGQYLFKIGSKTVSSNFISWVFNFKIVVAVILYCIVMFLFVFAFKLGGELTVLYPVYATTFIWAAIIGVLFLNEPMTISKAGGILLIILGVLFIVR